MREKINRLAKGIIDQVLPEISVIPENIDMPVKSGEIIKIEINIESKNRIYAKGLVYSSNYRVRVLAPSFGGIKNKITLEIDTRFLNPKEVIKGQLDLVTNAGEKVLPFSFTVVPGQNTDILDDIESIEDFALIAKADWESALQLFQYKHFLHAKFMNTPRLCALYSAFFDRTNKNNALEEFLIAAGVKTPVYLSFEQQKFSFSDLLEDVVVEVPIKRNTWGYLGFAIHADGDFVELSTRILTNENFTNHQSNYTFTIKKSRLYRGHNVGKIYFISVGESFCVDIDVYSGSGQERKKKSYETRRHWFDYTRARIAFMTKEKEKKDCIASMVNALENLEGEETKVEYRKLLLAEVYYLAGEKSKAADIIDAIRENIKENRLDLVEEYLLLEYLEVVVFAKESKRPSLIRLMRRMITENHLHQLLPRLIHLDIALQNDASELFELYKVVYQDGCTSPYLYICYCQFLAKHTEFLHDIGAFEVHAFCCGAKYHAISRELAEIIAKRAISIRSFEGLHFQLLKKLYKDTPEREFLSGICSALLRGKIKDNSVHHWYQLGIEQQIALTGINEAFVLSLPKNYDQVIPEEVLWYFADKKRLLDQQHRAYLYANILSFYPKNSEIYLAYIDEMTSYALEEAKQAHIDSSLAVIYQEVLSVDIVDEQLARVLPSILCAYRIQKADPLIKQVVVIYPQLKGEHIYAFEDGESFIPIPTDDTIVLFQDAYGNRYARFGNEAQMALDLVDVLTQCYHMYPSHPLLHIANLKHMVEQEQVDATKAELLQDAMHDVKITAAFKTKILSVLVQFYQQQAMEQWSLGADEFLESIDKSLLDQKERQLICNTFIARGRVKKAYAMIKTFGCDKLSSKDLSNLCTKLLINQEKIDDDLLLNLVFTSVINGCQEEIILDFAAKKYNGSSKNMYLLLEKAIEVGAKTADLEERLLAQMLFSNHSEHIDQTFYWYISRMKVSDTLVKAFFSLKSYAYFVEHEDTSLQVFEYLEASMETSSNIQKIPLLYAMALTKYYTTKDILNERQKALAKSLVFLLIEEDILFDYYKKLAKFIPIPEEILESSILVYHTKGEEIFLHSKVSPYDKEYHRDNIRNMYQNFYVATKTLFSGEQWDYKIYSENNGIPLLEGSLKGEVIDHHQEDSRFICLNKLASIPKSHLQAELENYVCKDAMTKLLFTIQTKGSKD